MLTFLEIENILLVEKASVDFTKGLCVLTGETGAGKSIILNSIMFLLGKKIKTDAKSLIRIGASEASVCGCFDVAENDALRDFLAERGVKWEDELVIKRVIAQKDRVFINGSVASGALLCEIGEFLIEVNRQNEQVGLMQPTNHLKILDIYGRLEGDAAEVRRAFLELSATRMEILETRATFDRLKNEHEYLESLVREIENLNLEEDEERKLAEKKIEMNKAAKESAGVNEVSKKLFEEKNVRSAFVSALKALQGRGGDENALTFSLNKILAEIDNLEGLLDDFLRQNNFDEHALEALNDRLFLIRDVARKYKVQPAELPAFLAEKRALLEQINFSEEKVLKLEKEEAEKRRKYALYAANLSAKRREAAKALEAAINAEFADLEMKGANFCVTFDGIDKESATGSEKIEFKVATNIGMPHGSLAKVASGGELSRLLLAIKIALLDVRTVGTIIFDEIDAGIGGKTSNAVAAKLRQLSSRLQVILITHQAQIASKADLHLKIEKMPREGAVFTSVNLLDKPQRIAEIARMLSGEQSEEAILNAKKLLELTN